MILVTVGAQMPFDRLVRAVDEWAGRTGRRDVLAQIGDTDYRPAYIESVRMIDPSEFADRFGAADVVVGHAGTGTILTALSMGKPILVMPRHAAYKETRNDHQIATAKRFAELGIAVAWDEHELADRLDRLDELTGQKRIGPHASPELIDTLRRFIEGRSLDNPAGNPIA